MSLDRLRDPEVLGPVLGQRLLTVTDAPEDDSLEEQGNYYMYLHFENGYTVKIAIDPVEGFEVLVP